MAAYWWYSTTAGSSAATTINFASTQHLCHVIIYSVTNTNTGVAVAPWTTTASPIAQAAAAADSTAPATTTDSKIVTLASAPKTGVVFYWFGRFGADTTTVNPLTAFTEISDANQTDASGSVASLTRAGEYVTAPPHLSATVGPAPFALTSTNSRVSLAWEWVPAGFVTVTLSGIEERA